MKKIVQFLVFTLTLIVNPALIKTSSCQVTNPAPKLFIAGGAMPETLYKEFLKMTGPDAKLVVIPTATSREIDEEKIKELYRSRGFENVSILHTNDPLIAETEDFSAPLRSATAVWFSGGSQQRIADAYLGTRVEKELYNLIQRGGVIGGSSAGAAIQTKTMISGGSGDAPKISTGFEILAGAILDQHFLKRNRFSRLIAAVHMHPELIGFGIDEGTAIVVSDNEYRVVGDSYVIRIEIVNGEIKIDSFEKGEVIPQKDLLK